MPMKFGTIHVLKFNLSLYLNTWLAFLISHYCCMFNVLLSPFSLRLILYFNIYATLCFLCRYPSLTRSEMGTFARKVDWPLLKSFAHLSNDSCFNCGPFSTSKLSVKILKNESPEQTLAPKSCNLIWKMCSPGWIWSTLAPNLVSLAPNLGVIAPKGCNLNQNVYCFE